MSRRYNCGNPIEKFMVEAKLIQNFEDKTPLHGIKGFVNIYFDDKITTKTFSVKKIESFTFQADTISDVSTSDGTFFIL